MLQEEFKKLKNLQETPVTHRILKTIEILQGNQKTSQKTRIRTHQHINLFTATNFVEQTIQTLTNLGEQLRTQLDFNISQQDM